MKSDNPADTQTHQLLQDFSAAWRAWQDSGGTDKQNNPVESPWTRLINGPGTSFAAQLIACLPGCQWRNWQEDIDPAMVAELAGLEAGESVRQLGELAPWRKRMKVYRNFDMEAAKHWRQPWLLPGWWHQELATILTGRGGNRKSCLAMQIACAVAAGNRSWLPGFNDPAMSLELPVTQGRMVYLGYEESMEQFRDRLARTSPGQAALFDEEVAPNLEYIAGGEIDDGPIFRTMKQGQEPELTDEGAYLLHDVCKGATGLVIDPSALAFAIDENSRQEVAWLIQRLNIYARLHKCAVLIIMHPPKDEGEGRQWAGSSQWFHGARAMWSLELRPVTDNFGKPLKNANNSNRVAPQLRSLKGSNTPPLPPLWLAGKFPRWYASSMEDAEQSYLEAHGKQVITDTDSKPNGKPNGKRIDPASLEV